MFLTFHFIFLELLEKIIFCIPCVANVFATCLRIRGNKNRRPGGKTLLRLWCSNGFVFHSIGCALRYVVQITNQKIKAILEIQKIWRYVIFSQKSRVISKLHYTREIRSRKQNRRTVPKTLCVYGTLKGGFFLLKTRALWFIIRIMREKIKTLLAGQKNW